MKYLKYVYIILIVLMSVGVVFAINNFELEISEGQNSLKNVVGEETSEYKNANEKDVTSTYQSKSQENISGTSNFQQNTSREEAEGETNITDKLKEHWYSGIITKLDGNTIYFYNTEYKKNYVLTVQDTHKFASLRTGKNIALSSIREGYYIDTFSYYMDDIFGIASNITGEELRQELLQNLALGEANVAGTVASPYIKNIDIINNNKAIITVEIQDMYGTELGNTEIFEFKFLLNENTKIDSKGGGAHSIETLNNAAHDIVNIYLDKNTLNNETPLITEFYSSDS